MHGNIPGKHLNPKPTAEGKGHEKNTLFDILKFLFVLELRRFMKHFPTYIVHPRTGRRRRGTKNNL